MRLTRDQLAEVFKDFRTLRAFEKITTDVNNALPSTIEEANALAAQSMAAAAQALEMLAGVVGLLEQLTSAPASQASPEPDDIAPRAQLGTISAQNADAVEITGGTVDNTPIGQTTAADAKFKKVAASDQITSTVSTGAAPFVIASTTRVANLNVASAGTADTLTSPSSFPAAATDLPTVIALANALRTAAIAKGL